MHEGKPLHLQPFPKPGDPPLKRPVPCAPHEAGHIPGADHTRVSRTAMGWTRDSSRLYLLIVREAADGGGWLLADVQRFWLARGVWGAVNIDGGPSTQAAWRRLSDESRSRATARYTITAERLNLPH